MAVEARRENQPNGAELAEIVIGMAVAMPENREQR
jgi:hypothetical protein